MTLLVFIVVNLVLMFGLFLVGVYLFMQIEEKRKRSKLLLDSSVDVGELRAMLLDDRYEDALTRLMQAAEVDRFTAETALNELRQQT